MGLSGFWEFRLAPNLDQNQLVRNASGLHRTAAVAFRSSRADGARWENTAPTGRAGDRGSGGKSWRKRRGIDRDLAAFCIRQSRERNAGGAGSRAAREAGLGLAYHLAGVSRI